MIILPISTKAKNDIKFECNKTELAKNEEMKCTVSGETDYERISIGGELKYDDKSFEVTAYNLLNGFTDIISSPTLFVGGLDLHSPKLTNKNFIANEITIMNTSNEKTTKTITLKNISMMECQDHGCNGTTQTIEDKTITISLLGDTGITSTTTNNNFVDASDGHELTDEEKNIIKKGQEDYYKSFDKTETTEESSESTGDVVENPKTGVSDNVYLLVIAMAILGLTIIVSRNFKFFRKLK